jgi:hypothetical protein
MYNGAIVRLLAELAEDVWMVGERWIMKALHESISWLNSAIGFVK